MANRVAAPTLFAPQSPNWSLALLDANAQSATGAINDSSLGSVNGPLADTGSVNAYAVTCSFGTPSAYNNGMTVFFNPASTNTGASTLTVSPLSSLPIVTNTGAALSGGELQAATTVGVICDGSAFRIFSAPAIAPLITSYQLRAVNVVGNSTFEVDQRSIHAQVTNATSMVCDRWGVNKVGTMTVNAASSGTVGGNTPVIVPGDTFPITNNYFNVALSAQDTSLAAGDLLYIYQQVEGPSLRELSNDVHSFSLIVRSSVASLNFSVAILDLANTKTLCKLCTTSATPNTWTLIKLPNLPAFSSGLNLAPGTVGYQLRIGLAAGSTYMPSANDTFQAGNFVGAVGMTNFAAQAVNSSFSVAYVCHQPGSNCQIIDAPFASNLDSCLRYYQKTYSYGTAVGTASTAAGAKSFTVPGAQAFGVGPASFVKPMAKVPTVTMYNHATGASGSVQDGSAVNHSGAVANSLGDSGFLSVGFTTALAGVGYVTAHYVADTGW